MRRAGIAEGATAEEKQLLDRALARLIAGAKTFKRNVENGMRQQARRGGLTRAPRNMEEVVRNAVPVLEDISNSLKQLVEIGNRMVRSWRCIVASLAPLC